MNDRINREMSDDPGIKITVEDLKTHDLEEKIITDGFLVITAGHHYVSNVQTYSNGTQVWTIKVDGGDQND